jgi:hypothetical protein
MLNTVDTEKGNDGDPWLDLEHLLEDPKQEVKLPSMVEVQNRYAKDYMVLIQDPVPC